MRPPAMLSLTADFNELLHSHGAPATKNGYSLDRIGEFLKEAYRIVRLPGTARVRLRSH